MKAHRGLTMDRMVKLGRVSRSGFYRWDDTEPGADRDMELRDAMQRIASSGPATGARASPPSCGGAAGACTRNGFAG